MSVDVTPSMNINFNKATNNKDPKFKFGDHVAVSKYKSYVQNWSKEGFYGYNC